MTKITLSSSNMENYNFLEMFSQWMINNPDEFEAQYPELSKGVVKSINNDFPDFMLENIIQKIPSSILDNLKEIEAITINNIRETKKNEVLIFINKILNKEFTNTALEAQRQKIIPELLEIKQALIEQLKHFPDNQTTDKKAEVTFTPETSKLKDWVYSDYINKFVEIEKELFKKGYINNSYQWQKHKTDLVDFTVVIKHLKYFKPIVKGVKKQDFHYRQFISQRYGYKKTGLTDTWKNRKPTFNTAKATFYWIESPD